MRVLCLIFAIVTILAQAPVPHANAAPTVRVTINIPTGANFGIPYAPKTKWQYSYADLLCTSKALEQCIVANMPLLSQVDDKLLHPTAHYTTRYLVKSGPNAGKIIWAEPQFGTPPTPYAPVAFAQNILNNGCYITSLTTLENAALANAPKIIVPQGRAATFNDIKADQWLKGHKPLNQLEWQYRRWADKLQPNKKDPKQPSKPDFLELPEFAADLPGAAATYMWGPASLSDASAIAAMKAGSTILIGFERFSIAASAPNGKGQVTLSLTYASGHKIAISGFLPGKYPLRINDVGNGKRYRIRFTSDLQSITFTSGGHAIAKLVLSSTNLPYANPVFLIYEGSDTIALDKGGELFIATEYSTLTLPKLDQVIRPIPGGPYTEL